MANPWRGEVSLTIDGQERRLKLTLGALAELEAELEAGSLVELVSRFETSQFTTRDVLCLIVAGLRGGGEDLGPEALHHADILGGPVAATRAAALLLARAFSAPEDLRG